MASLKQLFETNFPHTITVEKKLHISGGGQEFSVPTRIHYDRDPGVKYVSLYFERSVCHYSNDLLVGLVENMQTLLKAQGVDEIKLPSANFGFEVKVENTDNFKIITTPKDGSSETATDITQYSFSGKIYLYCEDYVELAQNLVSYLINSNITPIIRGQEFLNTTIENMKPKAFISHASADKDEIARPIATELQRMLCPVWYDEYSLTVGDSLRESIEKGLKESEYCILVLTPNFLSKSGWTKREFDSVFTRELIEDRKVILPVWHGVTPQEIYEYSPSLADRLGLNYGEGLNKTCSKLYSKIMSNDA